MKLLLLDQWMGPQHHHRHKETFEPRKELVSMATRLPLAEALGLLRKYEADYKARYPLAVEFALLAVSEIEELDDEELGSNNLSLVEGLYVELEG